MGAIRKLVTQRILGGSLPCLKFFEPKPRFIRWMKRSYPGSLIYDVGAGLGHVAQVLSEQGLRALALDLNYRESQENFPVVIADGESYQYQPNSIVMLCRPCHGQFVEEVASQAIRCNVAVVMYVGLDRNIEIDLGIHQDGFKLSLSGAGRDGEGVWVLARNVD
jgi:hypothetical protein